MKKIVLFLCSILVFIILPNSLNASDIQSSLPSEQIESNANTIINTLRDEIDFEVNSDVYIYCKCAYINLGWLARRIGIGNKKCLAKNIGSICAHGYVDCQQSNTQCGGTNPDPEVSE